MRLFIRCVALAIAVVLPLAARAQTSYIFAWTGDGDRKVSDFLAVIDADPQSKTYGHLVKALPVGATGTMPHHTEYEFPASGRVMANGWAAGKTFVLDLRNPRDAKVASTFTALDKYTFPHSFVRLPNGHLLATFQSVSKAYAPGGGLVELEENGKFVRAASAVAKGLVDSLAWPYSLAIDARHDRVITTNTSMGVPKWLNAPAGSWSKARVDSQYTRQIQVWKLSSLEPLATIDLPGPKTNAGPKDLTPDGYPAEPRLLPDGSMYVNTFQCGLYHVTDIDRPAPRVSLVHTFPVKMGQWCAVPALVGHYWVQPVAAAGGLIVLDISNPAKPREVDRLALDSRFMMPHWLAADSRHNRVVLTCDEMGYVIVINVDPRTGKLSLDQKFRDERTGTVGVNLDNRQYPQGAVKKAFVHGALFGPR